jgi:hypothetical protein
MSNHPKRGKHHPATNPKQDSTQKESTNRHVYVEPGVQIDVVQNLKNQHDAERQEDKATEKKQLFWTKIATGLLVLTAFIYFLQWRSQTDALKIDQRAWIGLMEIDGTPDTNNSFSIHGTFKNTGKTPAINVTMIAAIESVTKGTRPDIDGESRQEPRGKGLVMPTVEFSFTGTPLIFNERDDFYAHGKISYRDIFGVDHWTTFCQIMRSPGRYSPCGYHNEIDKN